ncbi:MAG: hypothetical protein L3K15_07105 [Thermoplasmata archaeon]|nr:hypothetical protein [Thermoplasmata archaeon]
MSAPAGGSSSVAVLAPIWVRMLPAALRVQAHRVWLWLLVGFAIRIVLLPLFSSSDLLTTAWVSTVLVQNHQLIGSNDPPPIFYLSGGFELLFSPLISPDLTSLFTAGASYTPSLTLQNLATGAPGINVAVAIFKLPYLIADFAVVLVLPRFFSTDRPAFRAMILWWFNPVSIFISYVVGQYDVIAVAFLVVAFYGVVRDRRNLTLVALGLATFFQVFSLLALPFILIYWVRAAPARREKVRRATFAVISQVVALGAVFLLARLQSAYYESANLALSGNDVNGFFGTVVYNRDMVAQPLVGGIITFLGYSARFPISDALPDAILIVVLLYALLLFLAQRAPRSSPDQVWLFTLGAFLIFYAFSGFLVQWVLWAQPFLIFVMVNDFRKLVFPYTVLILGFFVYTWYFGAALTVNLLQITVPAAASWHDPLRAMNGAGLPGVLVINIARSLFSAACLWFAYTALRRATLPGEHPAPSTAPGPS